MACAAYTKLVVFTWDHRKAASNLQKHGVSFYEAASVFYDPLSATFPDEENSENEFRFLTIGRSSGGVVLVVAHTEDTDSIGIISARAVTRSELKFYEEEHPKS
jgi:uncharacterized DUF497 family protein